MHLSPYLAMFVNPPIILFMYTTINLFIYCFGGNHEVRHEFYRRDPAAGEVLRGDGGEGEGHGMSEGLGREGLHRHRHVGRYAALTPRAVTNRELQVVPGEKKKKRKSEEKKNGTSRSFNLYFHVIS